MRTAIRLGLATVALAALPLATACQTRIGEAASVGGTQIETSRLTAVTGRSEAVLAKTGQAVAPDDRPKLQARVLNALVGDALLTEIGKAQGITVSQQDVNVARANAAQQAGGDAAFVQGIEQNGYSAQDVDLLVRQQLLVGKLRQKFGTSDDTQFSNQLTREAQRIGVRINPRFGSWDPKTLGITGVPSDLSSVVTRN